MFYVVMCRNCGAIRSCEVIDHNKYTFKCFTCNKSTKLKKKKEFGLSLKTWGPYNDGKTASLYCSAIKEKLARG